MIDKKNDFEWKKRNKLESIPSARKKKTWEKKNSNFYRRQIQNFPIAMLKLTIIIKIIIRFVKGKLYRIARLYKKTEIFNKIDIIVNNFANIREESRFKWDILHKKQEKKLGFDNQSGNVIRLGVSEMKRCFERDKRICW